MVAAATLAGAGVATNQTVPRRRALARPRLRSLVLSGDGSWLAPLLLLFIAKGLFFVGVVGPFTGHDEVDHFWYVARLAAGDGLGVVGEVELPPEARPYRNYVADYPTNAEVIQPPLYHALLTPVRWLMDDLAGQLYAMRSVSVLLGTVVVWLSYCCARLLFPGEALVRVGTPIFVAFQPQLTFESAIVNHDIMVITMFSLALYLSLRGLRDGFSPTRCLMIGLVISIGLWTKTSLVLVLPAVSLAIVIAWWDRLRGWRTDRQALTALAIRLALAVVLPLIAIVPWFIRSYRLYDDPTGAQRLREIPEYGDQASSYRDMITSSSFWRGRFEDFWGNYGWRQIPFDPIDYRVIWVVWGIAGIGLVALGLRYLVSLVTGPPVLSRYQVQGLFILSVALITLVYGVLYVGTIQFTQSRFAFPGMIAFGMLTTLGYGAWLPARWRPLALPVLLLALIALNLTVVLRFIIPFYFGPGGGALVDP